MTVPSVAQSAITHYLGKGLSKDIAVGICACLYYESKLNPGSQGVQGTETPGALNPSGAFGIASWNGPRQQALADFAKQKNEDPADINTQLDFVLTESANSYPTVWAAIQTGSETYQNFIPIFVADYENPADHQKEINAAMAYADAWYPLVATVVNVPPITPSVTPIPITPPPGIPALTSGNMAVIKALATAIIGSQIPGDIQALAEAIQDELVKSGKA